MTAIILTLIAVPSASGAAAKPARAAAEQTPAVAPDSSSEAAVGELAVSGSAESQTDGEPERAASERCKPARIAAYFFRLRTWSWQELRESRLATRTPIVSGKSCHWAKFAAAEWKARASSARRSFYRWLDERTLREHESWQAAIREVQVVFPGTASWMDSCSDAEGMSKARDREFYVYGFKPFSWAAWYSDTVGGPGQIRPSTFRGMYLAGLVYVFEHGFRVPRHLHEADTEAWQSMLAQAIAMGWARYTGNDNSHWSASWGRGC